MTEFGQRLGTPTLEAVIFEGANAAKSGINAIKDTLGKAVDNIINPPYSTPDGNPLTATFYKPGEVIISSQSGISQSNDRNEAQGVGCGGENNNEDLPTSRPSQFFRPVRKASQRFL